MLARPLPGLLLAAVALAAVALAAAALAAAPAADAADPCSRSRTLVTGPTTGALYATVAPFEHDTGSRTQVFPHTCTLAELTGTQTPRIASRRAPGTYRTPYVAATRDRDELYVYGYGADAARTGGFVARVDPRTLRQRWRRQIPDPAPARQWSYPGVLAVHGNGFLYAIYGNVLVKLDPEDGRVLARVTLPEDAAGTGAAYNGLVVLPDGRIATKELERGPCEAALGAVGDDAHASAGAFAGLTCAAANGLPSRISIVDPEKLRIVSTVTAAEPVVGRITWGRTDGRDYVYAVGHDHLFRYRYGGGRLRLDTGWGPVTYRTGDQQPGTGAGMLGRFVVVQTNFTPSTSPMTVTAVDARDGRRVFRSTPFPDAAASWIVSKAALDAANDTVITHDTSAGGMAALRLDPRRGFTVRWTRPLRSLDFSALVGDPAGRQIVITDVSGGTDRAVWLDERTGRERARSGTLAEAPAPGNIVVPGFGGRFYYVAADGTLWELRPRR